MSDKELKDRLGEKLKYVEDVLTERRNGREQIEQRRLQAIKSVHESEMELEINYGYIHSLEELRFKIMEEMEAESEEEEASEKSSPIWVHIVVNNNELIEIPIMCKSIVRLTPLIPLSESNPLRCEIKLSDGRTFEVIEDYDVVHQKIYYARRRK